MIINLSNKMFERFLLSWCGTDKSITTPNKNRVGMYY